jgi:hypothetical protein
MTIYVEVTKLGSTYNEYAYHCPELNLRIPVHASVLALYLNKDYYSYVLRFTRARLGVAIAEALEHGSKVQP